MNKDDNNGDEEIEDTLLSILFTGTEMLIFMSLLYTFNKFFGG